MTDCQLCLLKLIWINFYLKFDFSVNNMRLKMWFCKMTAFCSGHNVSRHAMSSVLIVSQRKHTCEIIVDVAAQLAAVKLINQMKRICQYLRPMRINKYILEHNAIWPVQTNYIGAFCLYGVHACINSRKKICRWLYTWICAQNLSLPNRLNAADSPVFRNYMCIKPWDHPAGSILISYNSTYLIDQR